MKQSGTLAGRVYKPDGHTGQSEAVVASGDPVAVLYFRGPAEEGSGCVGWRTRQQRQVLGAHVSSALFVSLVLLAVLAALVSGRLEPKAVFPGALLLFVLTGQIEMEDVLGHFTNPALVSLASFSRVIVLLSVVSNVPSEDCCKPLK